MLTLGRDFENFGSNMDLAFWLAIAAAILCVAVAIYGESKKDKK